MNSTIRRRMLAGAAVAAWAVAIIDATPWLYDLDEQTRLLTLCVAVASSVMVCISRHHRPVQEVYDMGYEAGRRQGRVDAAVDASPSVVPFRRRA